MQQQSKSSFISTYELKEMENNLRNSYFNSRLSDIEQCLSSEEMKSLEEWLKKHVVKILFDTNTNNWDKKGCEIEQTILNKKELLFVIETENGQKLGCYINVPITSMNKYIVDSNASLFEFVENNGYQFPINTPKYAIKIYPMKKDELFVIGDGDITIYKKEKKEKCFCKLKSYRNVNVKEGLIANRGKFTVKRICVVQMKDQDDTEMNEQIEEMKRILTKSKHLMKDNNQQKEEHTKTIKETKESNTPFWENDPTISPYEKTKMKFLTDKTGGIVESIFMEKTPIPHRGDSTKYDFQQTIERIHNQSDIVICFTLANGREIGCYIYKRIINQQLINDQRAFIFESYQNKFYHYPILQNNSRKAFLSICNDSTLFKVGKELLINYPESESFFIRSSYEHPCYDYSEYSELKIIDDENKKNYFEKYQKEDFSNDVDLEVTHITVYKISHTKEFIEHENILETKQIENIFNRCIKSFQNETNSLETFQITPKYEMKRIVHFDNSLVSFKSSLPQENVLILIMSESGKIAGGFLSRTTKNTNGNWRKDPFSQTFTIYKDKMHLFPILPGCYQHSFRFNGYTLGFGINDLFVEGGMCVCALNDKSSYDYSKNFPNTELHQSSYYKDKEKTILGLFDSETVVEKVKSIMIVEMIDNVMIQKPTKSQRKEMYLKWCDKSDCQKSFTIQKNSIGEKENDFERNIINKQNILIVVKTQTHREFGIYVNKQLTTEFVRSTNENNVNNDRLISDENSFFYVYDVNGFHYFPIRKQHPDPFSFKLFSRNKNILFVLDDIITVGKYGTQSTCSVNNKSAFRSEEFDIVIESLVGNINIEKIVVYQMKDLQNEERLKEWNEQRENKIQILHEKENESLSIINTQLNGTIYGELSEIYQFVESISKMNIESCLFDSKCCSWKIKTSTFNERIMNNENVILCVEIDKNKYLGGYISRPINKIEKMIADRNSFLMSNININDTKLINEKVFKNKNPLYAFTLYNQNDDCLFSFGDNDLRVNKENYKKESYCVNSQTNAFEYENENNGLVGSSKVFYFTPLRIVAFKMKK